MFNILCHFRHVYHSYNMFCLKCIIWLGGSALYELHLHLEHSGDRAQAKPAGERKGVSFNLRSWYNVIRDVKTVWVNQSRGPFTDYMYRGLCEVLYFFSDPCSILCNLFFFYKNDIWGADDLHETGDYKLSFIGCSTNIFLVFKCQLSMAKYRWNLRPWEIPSCHSNYLSALLLLEFKPFYKRVLSICLKWFT